MPSEDVSRSAAGRLRATAHPTRLAILHLLGGHPALTATECAKLLGESPKTCSYHLHQLAAHGYVAEVPAAGRIRPWRLAPDHAAGPAERRRAGDRGVAARLRREESVLGGADLAGASLARTLPTERPAPRSGKHGGALR